MRRATARRAGSVTRSGETSYRISREGVGRRRTSPFGTTYVCPDGAAALIDKPRPHTCYVRPSSTAARVLPRIQPEPILRWRRQERSAEREGVIQCGSSFAPLRPWVFFSPHGRMASRPATRRSWPPSVRRSPRNVVARTPRATLNTSRACRTQSRRATSPWSAPRRSRTAHPIPRAENRAS